MIEGLGAVVLAAGASTRLGRPKQLIAHEGRALVVHAANAALDAGASPVVVVIGAGSDAVGSALADLSVVTVLNARWAEGMGTSIAAGVQAVVEHAPEARGVLIVLADQPLVGSAALGRLVDAWMGAADGIAAAAYAGTLGVPALFGRAHFDALRSLAPGAGAARLLRADGARVRPVPVPEAELDVDTVDDLERLRAIAKGGVRA